MSLLSSFSERELKDIAIATVVLSLAFGLGFMDRMGILAGMGVAFVVVGVGFILHELAHRTVARRFGAFAQFRAYPMGLALALILAVLTWGRVVFAAPGAVMISSKKQERWHQRSHHMDLEETGLIAVAGPVTNIALAFAFLLVNFYFPHFLLRLAANVNLFLALFNLIPTPPLDGAKVMAWDRLAWLLTTGAAFIGWLV